MKTTRIYEVKSKAISGSVGIAIAEQTYLVDASSQAAAERHVAEKYVGKASVAPPKRLVELMGGGIKVEAAAVGE